MKVVTVWESQMQYWGNTKDDPTTRLMNGRGYHYYLSRERADEASPGGPAIERKVLERDGKYFMAVYQKKISEVPDPLDEGAISSIRWDEEMKRRGRA